jgi:pimeloyl-ACP methyl ester carboxylesterase
MAALVNALLSEALAEVTRREPTYFSRFRLAVPVGDECANELAPALDYLATRGAVHDTAALATDPLSALMLDCAKDACAASQGLLPLQPGPSESLRLPEVLASAYSEHRTDSGRRYFVRRRGSRPVLLISALGVPLQIWSKFLGDHSHDFRIIVVENRCVDLLLGGMHTDADLRQHAGDLIEVLDCEDLGRLDVLAWCNGGRIAVDLAARRPQRIGSLILLSTTFRGTQGVAAARSSPFEDSLQQIFTAAASDAALAPTLVKLIAGFSRAPDWETLKADAARRAVALFALPAKEHAEVLLAPMRSAGELLNYARRTAADEAYAMPSALAELGRAGTPILLITGENDTVVSNEQTRAALTRHAGRISQVTIRGAGHYAQDLQYPYLLWALRSFAESGELGIAPARTEVRRAHA